MPKGATSSKSNSAIAIAVIALALTMISVTVDARPSTRSFTCSGVKTYIDDRGAVVMNHKNPSLYQRFVAHAGYCRNFGGDTKRFSVPTKTGRCSLRICHEREKRLFLFGD